jgi:nucleoside-diphosphate-sugar epimerase
MKRSGAVPRASSVRLALAYGPGTKKGDSRVLNSFIEQAITSGQIDMKDAGLAWRTYCYILDAIELCTDVLKNGKDDIYNVGGISRLQIVDLAKEISRITNARLVVPPESSQFLNGAPNDVWLNLERVLGLGNKKDFISMADGLDRTINWTLQRKSSS